MGLNVDCCMQHASAMQPKRVEVTPRTVGYVVLAAAAVWAAFQLANVLLVIICALILVGTIDPLVAWLERKGFPRGRALATVFVVLTLALSTLLMLMVPAVVSQLFELTTEAPKARDQLVTWLAQYDATASIVKFSSSVARR